MKNNFDLNTQKIINKIIQCYKFVLKNQDIVFSTLKYNGPQFTKDLKFKSNIFSIKHGEQNLKLRIPAIVITFNNETFNKYKSKENHAFYGLYVNDTNNNFFNVFNLPYTDAGLIIINLQNILFTDKGLKSIKSLNDIFSYPVLNTIRHEITHFIQNVYKHYIDKPEFEYINYMLNELDDTDLTIEDNEPHEVEARIHENILYYLTYPLTKLKNKSIDEIVDDFISNKNFRVAAPKTPVVINRLKRLFRGFQLAGYFDKIKLKEDLNTKGEDYVFDRVTEVFESYSILRKYGYKIILD